MLRLPAAKPQAETETIFANSRHPYTRSLLDAIPVRNPNQRRIRNFLSREDIAAAIPQISKRELSTPIETSTTPQLVSLTKLHRVEAIVSA